MARLAINAGKGGRRKVPEPPQRASFVPGSQPAAFRSPTIPRIKPTDGQREYTKPAQDPTQTGFNSFLRD